MRTVVLLISFAFTILNEANGYSFGENLLEKLDDQVDSLNQLIIRIERTYRDDMYRHPMPRIVKARLRSAEDTLDRALRVAKMIDRKKIRNENRDDYRELRNSDQISGESSRRSNNPPIGDLKWKANFYKALSRALKEEFKDEPVVAENIQDGFAPPTILKKRGP